MKPRVLEISHKLALAAESGIAALDIDLYTDLVIEVPPSTHSELRALVELTADVARLVAHRVRTRQHAQSREAVREHRERGVGDAQKGYQPLLSDPLYMAAYNDWMHKVLLMRASAEDVAAVVLAVKTCPVAATHARLLSFGFSAEQIEHACTMQLVSFGGDAVGYTLAPLLHTTTTWTPPDCAATRSQ